MPDFEQTLGREATGGLLTFSQAVAEATSVQERLRHIVLQLRPLLNPLRVLTELEAREDDGV